MSDLLAAARAERRKYASASLRGLAPWGARYVRLLRGRLPAARPPSRARPVLATLTTIGPRAGGIAPVVASLLDQSRPPDGIVIAVPRAPARGPVELPPGVRDHPAVEVLDVEADQGPATKLLPSLVAHADALLVVTDDDVVYPRAFIESLEEGRAANPDAVVGLRGADFDADAGEAFGTNVFGTAIDAASPVDVLFGTWGFLVAPEQFDSDVHRLEGGPPEARWVDDVWFAGHLARAGVPRLVVPTRLPPLEMLASRRASLSFGRNRGGANDRATAQWFGDVWSGTVSPS